MVSFQGLWAKIDSLILKRAVILFLVGMVLSFFLVDQKRLKVKTINTLLPAASDLKDFVYNPSQMDRQKMKEMFTYYNFVCNIIGDDTFEKPASCGIAGYADYYLGEEKRSIEYFNQSNSYYPHSFWTFYDLGIIYYNNEDYDQAMQNLVSALSAYPYTVHYLMVTRNYSYMAGCLKLSQDDMQGSLDEAAKYAQKLYFVSKMFIENPDMKNQFTKRRLDLRLF